MTTPSDKPPLDEGLDVKWDAERPSSAGGATASSEAAGAASSGTAATGAVTPARAAQQLYGMVVPYGGDDRTEEIEPIELDMPFAPDSGRRGGTAPGLAPAGPVPATAPARRAPARPVTPAPAFAAPRRDFEMPVAHLLVSDLFDSSPPPSSALEPPDLAAFSTHPPPPPNGVAETPRAAAPASKPAWPGPRRASSSAPAAPPAEVRVPSPATPPPATPRAPVVAPFGATEIAATPAAADEEAITVVAMPSIDVGTAPGERPPSQPPPSNVAEPKALAADGDEAQGEDRQRRSVPTLESVGNAASRRAAADQGSEKIIAGSDGAALPALPDSGGYVDSTRFPSEVPTSRPPDVVLSPDSGTARRAPARAVASGITAPAPVNVAAQSSLPSIMLAPEVEAETVGANRRAQRAARATVRLELPPNFGRPGSPIAAGAVAVPAPRPLPAAVAEVAPAPSFLSKYGAWIAAAFLALACLVVLLMPPSTASLVVNALGPGQRAVEGLQIFVDGEPLACEASPCEIAGLSAGEHQLRATARGLSSGDDQVVTVEGGSEAILNLQLVSTEPERHSGGLRVAATDPPRTLYVDGTRVGQLPREVSGLAAGKHWLKLDAEDGSAPIEKSVTVLPGQVIDVDATAAKRDKALVTILLSPGSEGASVTLDEAFLLDFPAELELEPGSTHTLTATKPGYEDYLLEIQADAGGTEKTIEVALAPLSPAPAARPKAKAARKVAAQKSQGADATQGRLNISSVPPSQIILNGRPLGSTPKTGVAVPGDSLQTIVFVHPKMGRRRAQKFVPAGKERTVAIRF